jgi:hypothetical protein
MLVGTYALRLGGVGMNAFNVAGLVLLAAFLLVLVLGFVTKPTGTEDLSLVWGQAGSGGGEPFPVPWRRSIVLSALVMVPAYAAVYAALW